MSSFSLSKSDIAYMESLQLLADLYYKITGNISCASWLVVWDISTEVADVEENYDTDPEWGDERIPELKELNSEANNSVAGAIAEFSGLNVKDLTLLGQKQKK